MRRLLTCMLGLTLLALPAAAQVVWVEQGDAGDLPGTAQFTICDNQLDQIQGTFGPGDVDMYLITIPVPAAFSATTCGGTSADTKLMLFALNANGVTYNDDDPGGCGLQSTITGTYVSTGDQYYLAVCRYPAMPQSAGGSIWNSSPFNTERMPDGPGAPGPITGWTYDSNTTTVEYIIFLTGVSCSGPVATEQTTWGAVKSLYQ